MSRLLRQLLDPQRLVDCSTNAAALAAATPCRTVDDLLSDIGGLMEHVRLARAELNGTPIASALCEVDDVLARAIDEGA